jgi:homoserine kinase
MSVEKPFTLMVPCSTSNLGPGFDALGIALSGPDLIVRATPGGEGLRISRLSGEGADRLPRDAANRVIQAAQHAAVAAGVDPSLLAADLEIHSSIPLKRGLGSSAAAAVAGALLADQLLSGAVGIDRVQQVAVELDGHPDNVVPCLRGGAQVSVRDAAGRVMWCEFPIKLPLRGAIFIPDEELATSAARAVLPQQVPLADAVFNLGRTALFVAALGQGRIELLGEAMEDRLHQTPRAGLLPWLPELLREARAAGAAGAALSGAGTTVFALCAPESARAVCARMMEVAAALGVGGRADVVEVAVPGAHVLGSG